jgi:hypothetical protein
MTPVDIRNELKFPIEIAKRDYSRRMKNYFYFHMYYHDLKYFPFHKNLGSPLYYSTCEQLDSLYSFIKDIIK